MRSGDHNQITMNTCKRQNSLTYSDLPFIQETKYKNSIPSTSNKIFCIENLKLFYFISVQEEDEFSKLSLFDSTNINSKLTNSVF
jgi:hypothetical protein